MNAWKIFGGLVLTSIGVYSILSPDFPYFCYGALIVGPIYLIWGLVESSGSSTVTNQPTTGEIEYNIPDLPAPPPQDEGSFMNQDSDESPAQPQPPGFMDGNSDLPSKTATAFLSCGSGTHYKTIPMTENVDDFKNVCNSHGYSVDCFMGRGGMSEVYVGRDNIGKEIVLKRARGYRNDAEMNKPYQNAHEDCVKLIKQEAEFLSSLSPNPNIITFLDFIDENSEVILVEELIDGLTLREYVRKKRGLSLAEASLAASQLLDVVSFIHDSTDYVYRDLQPTNIMVTNGRIIVIDFGGVAKAGSIADKLSFAGYHGKDADTTVGKWLDTYSFANTLYFMFTGLDPPKEKDRGNAWGIMKHEMKKKEIPDMIIEAIHMARNKKITSAVEFRRFFRALAYGSEAQLCGMCSSPLQPGANHCIYCGAFKCAKCNGWRTAESAFCGECGHSTCPHCSSAVPSDSTVCMFCGENIKG